MNNNFISKPPFIPRIIFQTFSTWEKVPDECKKIIKENLKLNNNYEYRFYNNDEDIDKLLKNKPKLLEVYKKINPKYGACRADFIRYYLIYTYGGIYIDIKAKFQEKLDLHIQNNKIILLEDWSDRYSKREQFSQWFLAYPKNHELMKTTFNLVISNINNGKFEGLSGKKNVLKLSGSNCYFDAIHNILNKYPDKIIKKKDPWFKPEWQKNLFIKYDGTNGRYHNEQKKLKKHYTIIKEPILLK